MKNTNLVALFALFFGISFAQKDHYNAIPDNYKSHPEYGKIKINNDPSSFELIHLRTANSRTFKDQNNQYYTQTTGGFFHFKNDKNEWASIQEEVSKSANGTLGIFQSEMPISINPANGNSTMTLEKNGRKIEFGNNVQLNFLNASKEIIQSKVSGSTISGNTFNEHTIVLKDFFNQIDRIQTVEYWALRTDYLIKSKLELPDNTKFVEFKDEVSLPAHWKIQYDEGQMTANGWEGTLLITDDHNNIVSRISQASLYDSFQSKVKSDLNGHFSMGTYLLEKSKKGFIIKLRVNADWLNNDALVYPLTIDPTATNTYAQNQAVQDKNTQFNANCQATMVVTIPSSNPFQVTGTNISWRMWAKGYIYQDNYADKVEQRSRVGAHLTSTAWTATQSGSGSNFGGPNYNYTAANNGQTYTLNNQSIANGCYTPNNSAITYIWQGYQTFFPHTGSVPAVAKVAGCVTNYQELVVNTWIVTTTYNEYNLNVVATPSAQTICSGGTTAIALSSSTTGATFSWTFVNNVTTGASNGTGATIAQTLTATTTTPGTTTYTITPKLGTCVGPPVDVIVTVKPVPVIDAGPDQSVCAHHPVVLSGSGGDTYTWDNGVTNGQSFEPTQTTTYTVTGTLNGCTGTDQVTVTISPNPQISFTPDVTAGCAPLTVNFTNNVDINNDCKWIISDGRILTGCAPISLIFNTPGCYDVTLISSSAFGCVDTSRMNNIVCAIDNPVAQFTATPTELNSNNSTTEFVNTSTGATRYVWTFGDNSLPSNLTNPSHTYPSTSTESYRATLHAYNDYGCHDETYMIISMMEDLIFYVPNAFTPDADEFNPVFKPVFTSGFDPFDYHMTIFNRWGDIVFESKNTEYGWDGTYNGSYGVMMDNTYTWKIEFKTKRTDERKVYTGHVSVLK